MPRNPRTWPIVAALAAAGLLGSPSSGRADEVADAESLITAADARAAIDVLAGPAMQGRRVGTEGNHKAGEWIVARLKKLGFDAHFQPFEKDGVACRNIVLEIGGRKGPHAQEWVALGAHYDHVGLGEDGNGIDLLGGKGQIHPGADDNASGSTALLEVAAALAHNGPLARGVVLTWFDGEERGLWGSVYFVAHPSRPIEKCVAMINMDMVGRLRGRPLGVFAPSTGVGLADLVLDDAGKESLPVDLDPYMVADSDHYSFYQQHVPVVFFCTGLHAQYHRTTDVASLIDAEGIARVAKLALRLTVDLGERADRFAYHEMPMAPAGEQVLQGVQELTGMNAPEWLSRRLYGPVAGIFGHPVKDHGIVVDWVAPRTPAAAAGVVAGDEVVEAGGLKLGSKLSRAALLFEVEAAKRTGVESLEMTIQNSGGTHVVHLPLGAPKTRETPARAGDREAPPRGSERF